MDLSVPVSVPPNGPPAPKKCRWWRWGSSFLTISIILHLLFVVGATYLIIQTITAKGKATFTAASAPTAPTNREHSVQMRKKQQTMSAPAQMKRVTAAAPNTKVALPQMPALPTLATSLAPLRMAGMSGSGTGLGFGQGTAGAPGGKGINLFGVRTSGAGLAGTFYDLKQTGGKKPTNMTPEWYGKIIMDFVKSGFNMGLLNRYFKSDKPIFATQIWIPEIPADLGPAAFSLENLVQPRMWCVRYSGRVTAPGSFTFHFVGAGDDVMVVKFDGKIVLERCWYIRTSWKPQANYHYDFSEIPEGFAKGNAITVEAGKTYPMEVLIGEQPGGKSFAALLQEVDGVQYDKDNKGNPILPVFRMSNAPPDASTQDRPYPPHRDDGPVWKGEPNLD